MLSETDPQLADVLRKRFPVWGVQRIKVPARIQTRAAAFYSGVYFHSRDPASSLDFHWKDLMSDGHTIISTGSKCNKDSVPHTPTFCTIQLYFCLTVFTVNTIFGLNNWSCFIMASAPRVIFTSSLHSHVSAVSRRQQNDTRDKVIASKFKKLAWWLVFCRETGRRNLRVPSAVTFSNRSLSDSRH